MADARNNGLGENRGDEGMDHDGWRDLVLSTPREA